MTITTWNPSDAGTGISLSSGNTVETVGEETHTLTSAEQASMTISASLVHTPHWGAGGGAHNNTPPALVLNYIIKT